MKNYLSFRIIMKSGSICLLLFLVTMHVLCSAQTNTLTVLASGNPTNLRGAAIAKDGSLWVSGSNGYVGRALHPESPWMFKVIPGFEKAELRDIYALDSLTAIVMCATEPAAFLKTTDGGISWQVKFRADSPDYFFDGFDFWDSGKGICIGDPINNTFLIFTSNDFGESWQKVDTASAPKAPQGVYAFAASGTAIRCIKNGIVKFGTGGNAALLFSSGDYGKSWSVMPTSIMSGIESSGIFSIDCINDNVVCIAGGDYTQPDKSDSNLYYTHKKNIWKPALVPPAGYRSCVQYIGDDLVLCCGINGVDLASVEEYKFIPISNESYNTIAFQLKSGLVILAGDNGKVAMLHY